MREASAAQRLRSSRDAGQVTLTHAPQNGILIDTPLQLLFAFCPSVFIQISMI
jgi:hypothetical protein